MKLLLTLAGCCLSLAAVAQTLPQSLRIQLNYERSGRFLEQAVETIDAVSLVGATSRVNFEAGHSITLTPGFETQRGSLFTAEIKPVANSESEVSLKLKAYPNPFEQSTTIDYYLPAAGKVNLWITDAQGKIVGQLVNDENQSAGRHKIEWQAGTLAEGIYIPIVESNQKKAVTRVVKK
ncbi:T9SS type A sorting domain-containing protein [Spirosoma aerophilum]